MNIVILGRGNMGAPLARLAEAAGHQVESLDSKTDALQALRTAELVILAVKYEQALALVGNKAIVAALAGKIVVDITNPLTADYMALTIGHTSSAAEEIAASLPDAHVVKAFNTVFAALLTKRAEGGAVKVPVFVSGDHVPSVETVVNLAQGMGLTALPSGPLTNARYLEPMAELMIQFGYGLGHGDHIGFVLRNEATAVPSAS